ncbi:MAG: hypothetical protein KKF27_22045 [Gammaproteobacteria bacterium]|nr:hypothetical protein [Gammaproteobacteria bacterium]
MKKEVCPRCGGQIYRDHDHPSCLQCGYEPLTQQEKRRWYQENEKEMVKDLLQLGKKDFLKKWRVKGQYISHLRSSEEYRAAVARGAVRETAVPASLPVKEKLEPTNGLPRFPEFKDEWPAKTQLKWLEIYNNIAQRR